MPRNFKSLSEDEQVAVKDILDSIKSVLFFEDKLVVINQRKETKSKTNSKMRFFDEVERMNVRLGNFVNRIPGAKLPVAGFISDFKNLWGTFSGDVKDGDCKINSSTGHDFKQLEDAVGEFLTKFNEFQKHFSQGVGNDRVR